MPNLQSIFNFSEYEFSQFLVESNGFPNGKMSNAYFLVPIYKSVIHSSDDDFSKLQIVSHDGCERFFVSFFVRPVFCVAQVSTAVSVDRCRKKRMDDWYLNSRSRRQTADFGGSAFKSRRSGCKIHPNPFEETRKKL